MIEDDVVLVFENCEVARVPKDKITFLNIGNITESISFTPSKGVSVFKNASELHLSIEFPDQELVARCFKYKDITQVELEGVVYHMEWPDGHDYENPNQQARYWNDIFAIIITKESFDEFGL